MDFMLVYGVQLGMISAVTISVCAIILGFTLLKKCDDPDDEDDLGYLGHIDIFCEGGECSER